MNWKKHAKNPWVWLAVALLVVLKLAVYGWLILNYPAVFAVVVAVKLVLKFSVISAAVAWVVHRLARLVKGFKRPGAINR